ncbi:CGNR zinc finger domain-containing protein [Amycolatopsis cynarae]|uniref:CGNR zinc finger domain-containing protein n=1 Tax=Amycolatopsis cynarae TaxID=2995223 RepID=A0ABY7BAT7_9PSEU|nr:CGNR zinc finger domain-containing protein [Amycolatopsis sp. HUAS 11-8]WAL69080.1 CGNR zinc finger domain-containing protein [Amycolatopsis sp. HUAS 11-8]
MQTSAPLLDEPLPVELMNTIWADRDGVHDALAEQDGTKAWLHAVAPRIELIAAADLDALVAAEVDLIGERLHRLRDALRRLAAEATGDPRPAAASPVSELDSAVAEVNQAAAAVPRWSVLTWTAGETPSRGTGTSGQVAAAAVSAIAEEAIRLFTHPDRQRLRACLAPGCVLYFVKDHPRREWCSAGCGNRARAARHYQRHRVPGIDAKG